MPPPSKRNRPCRFYLQGKCSKGANCPFLHVAVEEGQSDAPSTSTSNNRKQKKKKKKHDAEDDNGSATQNGRPSQNHEPLDRTASSDTPAKTKKSKSKNRKSKDAATETEAVEEQSPTRADLSAIVSALRKHAECTQSNLSEMNDIMIQFGAKYAETQRAVNDLQVEILGLEAKMNQGQHKGPPVAVAGSTGERKQENDTSTSDVSDANAVMSTPARACTTSSDEIEVRAAPPDSKFAHSTNGNSSVAAPRVPTSVGTPINIKPMNIEQKAPLPRSAENQTVNGGAPKHGADPRAQNLRAKSRSPPVSPTWQEATTATSVQPPKPPPPLNELEDIVSGYSTYIIGPPKDYVSDLHNELDIETAKDFAEALGEGLEVIANMSSGRATGHDVDFYNTLFGKVVKDQRQFCEKLLAAILSPQPSTSLEADAAPDAGRVPGVSSSIANAQRTMTVRTKFEANVAKKFGFGVSNPCRLVSRDEHETVERQKRRQEEAAAKAAQKAKTKAKKTQRREAAKQEKPHQVEKPATLNKKYVNVCVEVDLGGSDSTQPKTTATNKKVEKAVPIPTSGSITKASAVGESSGAKKKSDPQDSKHPAPLSLSSIKRDKSTPFADAASRPEPADPLPSGYKESIEVGAALSNKSKRKRKGHRPQLSMSPHVSTKRLSSFIHSFPEAKSANGCRVSTIFRLLQNESTLKSGRELLRLEKAAKDCQNDIHETENKIKGLDKGIESNKMQLVKWQAEREKEQRRIYDVYAVDLSDSSHANVERILREIREEEEAEEFEEDEQRQSEKVGLFERLKMLMEKDEEFDLTFQDAENGKEVLVKARGRSTVHDILCNYARAVESAGASEHFFFYGERQLLPNTKTFLKDLQIDPQDTIIAINKRPPGWVESDSDDGTDTDGEVAEIEDDEVTAIEDGFVSADEYKRSIYSSVLLAEESKQRAVRTLSDDDKIWLEVDAEARKIKMKEERKNKSESIEAARRNKAYQRSVKLQVAKQERNKVHAKRIRKKREDKIGHAKRDRDIKNIAKFIERLKSYIPDRHQSIQSQIESKREHNVALVRKKKKLGGLRSDMGRMEDEEFHIDGSRDERNHTFLMVAAQNNDYLTAKLCLELGANPLIEVDGVTAVHYSYFFSFDRVTDVIVRHGGVIPKKAQAWDEIEGVPQMLHDTAKDWTDALTVAQTAELSAQTLMESVHECEKDKDKRMERLAQEDIANGTARSKFVDLIEGLKPTRREGVTETRVHRRSIIGTTTTFELLAAAFEGDRDQKVALFTPYVAGEVDGVENIGVLVWAICTDQEASMIKTLISNTEFIRNKVERAEERFAEVEALHAGSVLKLGRDMHLLDLKSKSIYTTSTMELYILEETDLFSLHEPGLFAAKKRIIHSEALLNQTLFRGATEDDEFDHHISKSSSTLEKSRLITGGAGVGKTLLLVKKVAKEDPSKRILCVSRLSKLMSKIKSSVEGMRTEGLENVDFLVYDELLRIMSHNVMPANEEMRQSFVQFDRIGFDLDATSGVSFLVFFIEKHLSSAEHKKMTALAIEPLILWTAITTIKSNAKCASSKTPLSRADYLALPPSHGLTAPQRNLCYDLFVIYENWKQSKSYWDEHDRVMYILRHGPSVFRDEEYIGWWQRVNKRGEYDLFDGGMSSFLYDMVFADEAQDFTELDLCLFFRMSSSPKTLFISADPAQSVELGISMRASTVNDVFHSMLTRSCLKVSVKETLDAISLQTNHRTHHENLSIAKAVRKVLTRSFDVPGNRDEQALIHGNIPQLLRVDDLRSISDKGVFKGGSVVFIAPDDLMSGETGLRKMFKDLGITNDVFGVSESKGLEFDSVALIGFFGWMATKGSTEEWTNALRWLSSTSKEFVNDPTGERVGGTHLAACNYVLSHPEVGDQAMVLYTAITRARNQLYLIEAFKEAKGKKAVSLPEFAYRRFLDLELAKRVSNIDTGFVEMSPAEHKTRGISFIVQALDLHREKKSISLVKDKLLDARSRFLPSKGNDRDLLMKCDKHLECIMKSYSISCFAKTNFFSDGVGDRLAGKFNQVLEFEDKACKFFSRFLCDPFMVEEVTQVRRLMEDIFVGTVYEVRFVDIINNIAQLEDYV